MKLNSGEERHRDGMPLLLPKFVATHRTMDRISLNVGARLWKGIFSREQVRLLHLTFYRDLWIASTSYAGLWLLGEALGNGHDRFLVSELRRLLRDET